MTRKEYIDRAVARLSPLYGAREAASMAYLVAETLVGVSRPDVALDPGAEICAAQLDQAIAQVAAGRPVQYVLGQAWFCGKAFHVAEGVLIPRGETEELVVWIAAEHGGQSPAILDIGTGSGAIAVSLAGAIPRARIAATDVSPEALRIAARNADVAGAKIEFQQSDILHETPGGTYDIVVSNPPYIPRSQQERMAAHVTRHEPHLALFVPDNDPLLFYRAIARRAAGDLLAPGGWIYFEVHEEFAQDVCAMLAGAGFDAVALREDIHGKPRMVRCKKK